MQGQGTRSRTVGFYHLAPDFLVFANGMIEALPRGRSHLADQLARASLSIVLNLAKRPESTKTVAGTEFGYDRLVLASDSHVMPLSLGHQPGVKLLTYRTLGDAQRILAEVNAAGERSAIVIGAGLLGCIAGWW